MRVLFEFKHLSVVVVHLLVRKEPTDSAVWSETLVVYMHPEAIHHFPCVVRAGALYARDQHVSQRPLPWSPWN